jgi:hypothetical protein
VVHAAGNGFPPEAVRRASSTAELASFLAASPGSKGRPSVIFTTIQKLGHLWKSQNAGVGRAGAAAKGGSGAAAAAAAGCADPEDASLQEIVQMQQEVGRDGCPWLEHAALVLQSS